MTISSAIPPGDIASVVGYGLGFKDFSLQSINLPQRIAIYSQIETSKQSGFSGYNIRNTVKSVEDVINLVGICPAYYVMRILKPVTGGGVGSIPIDIFPIQEGTGSPSDGDLTISGTANKTTTHIVNFNGRDSIDGESASYVVENGEAPTATAAKLVSAVNNMSNAPVSAVDNLDASVSFTSKWQGESANEISITINVKNEPAGLTYTLPTMSTGSGTIDITTALSNIGDIWNTACINTFDENQFDSFADFNGEPADTGGTGRWNAKVAKPFIACTGTVESSKSNLIAFGSGRETDLTNCLGTAPNSPGYTFEASANYLGAFLDVMNRKPHSSSLEVYFWDMPFPSDGDIGVMKNYDDRNDLVTNGISTVTFDEALGYRIQDFVTFRRLPAQSEQAKDWRYCRDIAGIDFNIMFLYLLLEQRSLRGKTIMDDTDQPDQDVSGDVIKPKDWKGLVTQFFTTLNGRALIAEPEFSEESLQTDISGVNPQRIDTTFNYKRTGIARVSSTTAYAGFNFGN